MNYMDRKKCYSLFFFDYKECPECIKYKECLKQKKEGGENES